MLLKQLVNEFNDLESKKNYINDCIICYSNKISRKETAVNQEFVDKVIAKYRTMDFYHWKDSDFNKSFVSIINSLFEFEKLYNVLKTEFKEFCV